MKDVVSVDAVRTPVGNHGGMLRDFDPTSLVQIVIKGILERTQIDPSTITEVILAVFFNPAMPRILPGWPH